jgi:hypothetical protein
MDNFYTAGTSTLVACALKKVAGYFSMRTKCAAGNGGFKNF